MDDGLPSSSVRTHAVRHSGICWLVFFCCSFVWKLVVETHYRFRLLFVHFICWCDWRIVRTNEHLSLFFSFSFKWDNDSSFFQLDGACMVVFFSLFFYSNFIRKRSIVRTKMQMELRWIWMKTANFKRYEKRTWNKLKFMSCGIITFCTTIAIMLI